MAEEADVSQAAVLEPGCYVMLRPHCTEFAQIEILAGIVAAASKSPVLHTEHRFSRNLFFSIFFAAFKEGRRAGRNADSTDRHWPCCRHGAVGRLACWICGAAKFFS